MLQGVERLVDLAGVTGNGLVGAEADQIRLALQTGDVSALSATDGHFSGVAREDQTVRMARTIGLPLRYFVAKMFHGPFLVVGDRIDTLFNWCQSQKIGWQFDPVYTRMIPAHYMVELDQIGCPDPAPRYHRFFDPEVATAPADVAECGSRYVEAAYLATRNWIESIPADEPIAVAFSGGVDSVSALLLARKALLDLGRDATGLRPFTLDFGGGADAIQAETVVRELGIEAQWERIEVARERFNIAEAIRVIEDYHPLDVECAAAALCLLSEIRERYPAIKYLIDGDGGDENLKSYPLEDSDLTLSSILRNPMLYQEGWGVDAIKHSLTYSGGLSRSYVRTYAPAQKYGFYAYSPFIVRSVIKEAVAMPFEKLLDGKPERLYTLKQDVVSAGVERVTGIRMPVSPKRRFQDGVADDTYRSWKVSKAECKQIFLKQWETRLREAWNPDSERLSGNAMTVG